MDQLVNVLWTIDNAHIPQRALDCRLGLGGLNQIYGPNHPTPSARLVALLLTVQFGCIAYIYLDVIYDLSEPMTSPARHTTHILTQLPASFQQATFM